MGAKQLSLALPLPSRARGNGPERGGLCAGFDGLELAMTQGRSGGKALPMKKRSMGPRRGALAKMLIFCRPSHPKPDAPQSLAPALSKSRSQKPKSSRPLLGYRGH